MVFVVVLVAFFLLPQADPYSGPLKDRFTGLWDDLNTSYYSFPETLDVTIQRTYIISNPGGSSSNYNLVLNLPDVASPYLFNEPTYQKVNYVESSVPYNAYPTPDFMHWSGTLESQEAVEIVVTYSVRVEAIQQDLAPSQSGKVADIPQGYKDMYLGKEWKIDPELTEVKDLANQLSAGTQGNVVGILRNIYDFIQNNITYKIGTYPKTCDETLGRGYGDCDDMSILFASVARAVGIPTWLELGLLSDGNLLDWTPHAWANAVIPVKDAGEGSPGHIIGRIDLANGNFLWMHPYRMSEGVSNGTGDQMLNYYYRFSSNGAKLSESLATIDFAKQGEIKRELD